MLNEFWIGHDDFGFHPEDLVPESEMIDWDPDQAADHQAAFDADASLHRKLHRNLLPQPFAGDLKKASVFLLYGNPGVALSDYYDDHRNDRYAELCRMNLRGELDSFVWLHPDIATTGPGIYWRQTFKALAKEITQRTGDLPEASFNRISRSVALVEAGAYHSKQTPGERLFQLRSSRVAGDFARNELRSRALRGECFILVWRRARFWGIEADANILVRPPARAQGRYFEQCEHGAILQQILSGG